MQPSDHTGHRSRSHLIVHKDGKSSINRRHFLLRHIKGPQVPLTWEDNFWNILPFYPYDSIPMRRKLILRELQDGEHYSTSGCGSVGRAVASATRGLRFKSSHQQNLYWTFGLLSTVLKRLKRPEISHLKKYQLLFEIQNKVPSDYEHWDSASRREKLE